MEELDFDSVWGEDPPADFLPLSISAPPHASPEYEELPDMPRRIAPPRTTGRLQGKAFFLTYSQSRLIRDRITQWFSRQPRMKRMIVGQEHHQDGHVHWHVLIEYENVKDVRSPMYYDIDGEHPNCLIWTRGGQQTFEQWFFHHWNYCKKEDPTPFVVGEEPKDSRKRKRNECFAEAMQIAKRRSVRDAMEFLGEHAPYDVGTRYTVIEASMHCVRREAITVRIPARPLEEFDKAPPIPVNWKVLFIYGRTGLGKTEWASALLPEATVVSNVDQLRSCDFSKGIIFDDFPVKKWLPTSAIHILDWKKDRGINVKHSHVVIPAKTRKIFTYNMEFEDWLPEGTPYEQVEALRRRVHVVHVTEKTYSAESSEPPRGE